MPEITQRSFTAGELSPALGARADLAKYALGLFTCRNFEIRAQGGAYNRAGQRFVGEVKDSTKRHRLIPFEFSTTQTYALEFGHLTMRVIKDGGIVVVGAGPTIYELVTPYTEAQLPDLIFTQSADVMTITHEDHDPYDLTRTAHDAWTITAKDFASTVSAPTGLSTVAVGTGAGTYDKTYRYVVTAIDADGVESLASSETDITTASLTQTAGVKIAWSTVTGAVKYNVYKDPSNGTGIYGWIGETVNLLFEDYNIGPLTSLAPPEDNEPFDGTGNKPSAVGYYQQRQIFAGSVNAPQTMYATQTANFNSLRSSTPTRADDSITFTINSRQVNAIRHIVAVNELILLTSGAEWKVSEGADFVLTPGTIGARPQSYVGASRVTPVVVGGTVIFVQEEGSKLWSLEASAAIETDGTQRLADSDMTVLSDHLFKDKVIEEIAYAKQPHGIIRCVQDDGTLLGMTFQKEHKIHAWHRHDTQGTYESLACISESGRTATYVIVRRYIDGTYVRYIERMEPREEDTPEDCFYVDSGLTYDGAPATVISNLDHLEGEDVSVLADGNVVKGLTVSSGEITLPTAASKVHVGLGYTCDLETLDVDSAARTVQGILKSVDNVALKVYKSRGGWVGPDFDHLLEIKPRYVSDGYDTIALKTHTEEINIQAEWNDGGRIAIRQTCPLPFAVLAATPRLDFGG